MPARWIGFAALVAILLLVDLALLPRLGRPSAPAGTQRAVSTRLAWIWTGVLVLVAGGFALWLWSTRGSQPSLEFATAYLIEASLSVDNLFVFLLLFRSLKLSPGQQHRVLLWGILGAIVLRGLLIFAGTALLERFAWVQVVFGAILAFAAVRLLLQKPGAAPVRGPVSWIQRCCLGYADPTRLEVNSLLLIILAVEATDLVFALDSIPAVLAVTRTPYVALTSNIFAVLGLRSLYFALASVLDRFRLLHYGLACVLAFVAFKMLAARWVEIPTGYSLLVIVAILAIFAFLSKALPARPGSARTS